MPSCLASIRSHRLLIVATAVLTLACTAARAADIGEDRSALMSRLLPTVVKIDTSKIEPESAAPSATPAVEAPKAAPDNTPTVKEYVGSGFIIDPSGLIVTNYHVVENAFEAVVTTLDGTRLQSKTLYASRLADLALLKVDAGHPLPAAHWGDSDALKVGDQVFAVGNPFGIGISVSAGIVSGLNRDIQNSPYDALIQTDATINHGNSGGPLFDLNGDVIGVNSAILSPTAGSSGLGFAIPSRSARFVIDRLQAYGWVKPSWIGVKVQQVTPAIAKALGMARPEGAIVAWAVAGRPAANAGLQIGDVITKLDGEVPTDERALLRGIAHTTAGETVTLTAWRAGQERDVKVTVQSWPREAWDKMDAPTPVERPKLAIPADLGLSLAPLSKDDRARLEMLPGLPGVRITAVPDHSDPAHKGVKPGDVILQVEDKPVTSAAEVLADLKAARASNRGGVMLLLWPKVRENPGPKWIALELGQQGG